MPQIFGAFFILECPSEIFHQYNILVRSTTHGVGKMANRCSAPKTFVANDSHKLA